MAWRRFRRARAVSTTCWTNRRRRIEGEEEGTWRDRLWAGVPSCRRGRVSSRPHGGHAPDGRRRRRRGPRGGRAARPPPPRAGGPRAPRAARDRDLEPQQRGDPRRDVLPRGHAEGPTVRAREADALRALRATGRPPPPDHQARRGHDRGRNERAGAPLRPRPRERRPSRDADGGGVPGARAGRARRGRPLLAHDRHRERARPHGRPPPRGASPPGDPPAAGRAGRDRAARPRLPARSPDARRGRVLHQRAGRERGRPRSRHRGRPRRHRRGRGRLPAPLVEGQLLRGSRAPRRGSSRASSIPCPPT